jgi:hypothetical protein
MTRRWASVGVAVLGLWACCNTKLAAVSVCDEASLRAAVVGGGHITFACDGTIGLSSPLVITQNVVLDATGRNVTISGNDQVRIFEVGYGYSLHLINLTVSQGRAQGTNGAASQPGGRGGGGAISFLNLGTVRAKDCRFLSNQAVGGRGGDGDLSTGPPGAGGAAFGGAISGSAAVYLTNCVFRGNAATGGAGGSMSIGGPPIFGAAGTSFGGAVSMTAGLVVAQNCEFGTNTAISGGALHLSAAPATVTNCVFTANVGRGRGGAIFHELMALTVTNSRFASNWTTGRPAQGGAIFKASGALTLERCEFTANSAVGDAGVVILSQVMHGGNADGGALFIAAGDAAIDDCTFASNAARAGDGCCPGPPGPASPGSARGGAIYTEGVTTIRNGTFVHNTGSAGAGLFFPLFNGALGGAIASPGGSLRVEYSTIASNAVNNSTTSARGAGIYQFGGSLVCLGSILAGNTTNGILGENILPPTVNGGSNLSSDGTGGGANSFLNVDPKLVALADNGGPVRTMALSAGSPAIDKTTSGCLPADARGVLRGQPSGKSDLGAFEQPPLQAFGSLGGLFLRYFAVPNETYALESSSNLLSWEEVARQQNGILLPVPAAKIPGEFFRVRFIP